MTASSVDTAELPRVQRRGGPAPAHDPQAPVTLAVAPTVASGGHDVTDVTADPAASLGRIELRAERRMARRQRQRVALVGIGLMAVALALSVAVLDVIR